MKTQIANLLNFLQFFVFFLKKSQFIQILISLILILAVHSAAFAKVEVSIRSNGLQKSRILLLEIGNSDYLTKKESQKILQKLSHNLLSTGLFEIIEDLESENEQPNREFSKEFSSSPYSLKKELTFNDNPDFEKYEKAKVDLLLIYNIRQNSVGNAEIRMKLFDIADRREVLNKSFVSLIQNAGKSANLLSNEIYVATTGESKGHFASKILYVAESGNAKSRIKKISMIDFDGQNHRNLTDGTDVVLTPIFSKKPDEIFYVRYFQGRPQIFSMNLNSQKTNKIGGYRGTTLSPSPHPFYFDVILLSSIDEGNSDIHQFDIANNIARRITKSPAIDTTASFSPDGKFIIFASDRDSGQQIYRMNLDGSSVERISKGEGTYANPQISPDGRFIAFTKIFKNKFAIGIMSLAGRNEKILTTAYLVEGAKWSPSGRYLLYSKKLAPFGKDSIPRLWIVDVLTGFEYELPTPKNEGAVDPDWGI